MCRWRIGRNKVPVQKTRELLACAPNVPRETLERIEQMIGEEFLGGLRMGSYNPI
jgi:hypothetical protein